MVTPQNKTNKQQNKQRNPRKTNRGTTQPLKLKKRHQPHHQLYPYAPLPCKIVMHIQQYRLYSPKYHKGETSFKPSYHNIIVSLPLHSNKVTQSLKEKLSLKTKPAIYRKK